LNDFSRKKSIRVTENWKKN